jgi:hypothetical protein
MKLGVAFNRMVIVVSFMNIRELFRCRGERVNGSHLRDKQDKIKTICKVENLHKWAFGLKGVLLKYTV